MNASRTPFNTKTHMLAWLRSLLLVVVGGSQRVTSWSSLAGSVVAFHPLRTAEGRADDKYSLCVVCTALWRTSGLCAQRLANSGRNAVPTGHGPESRQVP